MKHYTLKTLLATLLLLCHYGIATHSHAQASFFDPTFGVGGKTIVPVAPTSNGIFFAIGVQSDGKIIASGIVAGKAVLVRYKDNGTPDSTFATNGYFVPDIPSAIPTFFYDFAIQSDGKIVAVGNIPTPRFPAYKSDFLAVRLNTDGSVDGSFGVAGQSIVTFGGDNHEAKGVAVQADGKIVLVGSAQSSRLGLTRLNANGQIDSAFGTNGTVLAMVCHAEDVDITSDGKIVVGGNSSAAKQYALLAVRYLPNGQLDTSFNHTGIVYTIAGEPRSNFGKALKVQPDGKVLLAGIGSFGTEGSNMVAVRYNTDGSLDDWFGTGGIASIDIDAADESCLDIQLAPTGKIMLVGSTVGTGKENVAVVRLKTNGTLDWLFGVNGKIVVPIRVNSDYGYAVALQTDEKLVFCGNTYRDGGSYSDPYVARLTPYPTSLAEASSVDNHPIVFPNPAKDVVFIRASIVTGKPQVTLCDMAGNNIHIDYIPGASSISVSNLPNGLYLMRLVYADGNTRMQRLVVQH